METGSGATEEAEVAVTCLEVGAWSKVTQALAAAGGAEEEEEVVLAGCATILLFCLPQKQSPYVFNLKTLDA